jgi:UDP-3-O-[3-hydroxymyristoyl] glucosamine N-acyltransferase
LTRTFTLDEIARHVGGVVEGDAGLRIEGVRPLADAGPAHLAFLARALYARQAAASRAGALLVSEREKIEGRNLVRVPDPYAALARALELFHPPARPRPGVDPEARVGPGCEIDAAATVMAGARLGARCAVGARAQIHPGVVLGDDCRVGRDTILYPNVTLYPRTVLGERVAVHSGAVVGSDGFGFAREAEGYRKIPQVGWVEVGDDVEIGANSTIDRGTLGPTRIGRGAKIDNLVQVAHNVQIGEHCVLVAQSGVAGSTRLGSWVTLAGQSGAAGHLEIGEGASVGAKSAVTHNVPPGAFVVGHPAVEHRQWKRMQAALRRLPETLRRLRRTAPAGRKTRREE